VIAAQTGIAGSAQVGKHVTLGGQVAVTGHISIADNTMIGGRGGVVSSIDKPGVFSGLPAIPHRDWLKTSAIVSRLPEFKKTITKLEARITELEHRIESAATNRVG
jgi:UDP-3-O-[3-hydroxymyristoyl] glucosamine N-acyltransferase